MVYLAIFRIVFIWRKHVAQRVHSHGDWERIPRTRDATELNAHQMGHNDVGDKAFAQLQEKIHAMIFADRVLEDETLPNV